MSRCGREPNQTSMASRAARRIKRKICVFLLFALITGTVYLVWSQTGVSPHGAVLQKVNTLEAGISQIHREIGIQDQLIANAKLKDKAPSVTKRNKELLTPPPATAAGHRVLHVVTSLREYDDGRRETGKGWDRLWGRLLATLLETIQSQGQLGFELDVVLVLGFTLEEPRRTAFIEAVHRGSFVQDRAMARVIQIWDDAYPTEEFAVALAAQTKFRPRNEFFRMDGWKRLQKLGKKFEFSKSGHPIGLTNLLSRQHRIIVAQHLEGPVKYDIFSCWEDDVFLSGPSLNWFVELSAKFESLAKQPDSILGSGSNPGLTSAQVQRYIPGFVRVEDIGDADRGGRANMDGEELRKRVRKRYPAPQSDFKMRLPGAKASHQRETQFSTAAALCCNRTSSQIKKALAVCWETSPESMSVTALPEVGWVALGAMAYPDEKTRLLQRNSFWVGHALNSNSKALKTLKSEDSPELRPADVAIQHSRYPDGKAGDVFGQQGGWVLTREQLLRIKEDCNSFLPPWEPKWFVKTVEFYSGGYQLFNGLHCGLQRVFSLSPEKYGNHLLHHVSQNKHRTPSIGSNHLVPQDTMLEVLQDAAYQAWQKDHAAHAKNKGNLPELPPAFFDRARPAN